MATTVPFTPSASSNIEKIYSLIVNNRDKNDRKAKYMKLLLLISEQIQKCKKTKKSICGFHFHYVCIFPACYRSMRTTLIYELN